MVFSKYSLLFGFFLGLSFPVSRGLAEPINNDKEIPPATIALTVCRSFTPLENAVAPTVEETGQLRTALPNSVCAQDLLEVEGAMVQTTSASQTLPAVSQAEETPKPVASDPDRWRFTFQPYVTVPVSTYGSATVRGRTVDYHLGLGSLLQSLKFTASGRVEAWKGNWGFIIDGYYTSLGSITNIQRVTTRTPSPFNTVDYLLSRGINTNLGEFADQLNQQVQTLREAKELQATEIQTKLATLTDNLKALKETLGQEREELQNLAGRIDQTKENLAQKEQRLETLTAKVEDLKNFREVGFELDADQKIKAAIAINSAIAKNQDQLQDLQDKIEKIGDPPSLNQVRQNLQAIQETLAETQQKVDELRRIKDSEPLKQLQGALDETQAQVKQKLEKLETIKDFVENRDPQQINNDITSNLDFSQGIYDFALTYNFGDTPPSSLPKEPSGHSFPRIWFQPIIGARLNSLNLKLENTINYQISSTLVNIEGTAQNTYQASKLWFEPLLGAKVGIQLSDPISLWLRGDYSGFGMAGDTDYSWNLLFGMDYWVRENISLQLGYRFYEINYQNGSGSNAFGFSESFNGPFLSASFHF
jgi:hypothetical protein